MRNNNKNHKYYLGRFEAIEKSIYVCGDFLELFRTEIASLKREVYELKKIINEQKTKGCKENDRKKKI